MRRLLTNIKYWNEMKKTIYVPKIGLFIPPYQMCGPCRRTTYKLLTFRVHLTNSRHQVT